MATKKYYKMKEKKSPTLSIFFGIVVFVFLLFPFFIINLRYEIGSALSIIINGIGGFSMVIGWIFLVFGVVGVITRSRYWVRHVVIGVILLWIGAWCTGAIVNFFGFNINNVSISLFVIPSSLIIGIILVNR